MTDPDGGTKALATDSAVSGRRLSRVAILLDTAAFASVLTLLIGVLLNWWEHRPAAGFLFYAIPLLSLAGVLTAMVARVRHKDHLATGALALGLLLFVPSAIAVCLYFRWISTRFQGLSL